jgi:hypothetical protein
VLVGYSFGADALPAIIPALPADLRDHVKSVVLIGTGPTGDLTFRPASWFDHFGPDAYPVAPAIAALKGLKTTCVYGDQERHDICASLPADIAQVRLPGGHHFNGDYVDLGQAVAARGALGLELRGRLEPSAHRGARHILPPRNLVSRNVRRISTRLVRRREIRAKHKHVGVVMLAGSLGHRDAAAQRGAHLPMAIGGHGHRLAGTADQDAKLDRT